MTAMHIRQREREDGEEWRGADYYSEWEARRTRSDLMVVVLRDTLVNDIVRMKVDSKRV